MKRAVLLRKLRKATPLMWLLRLSAALLPPAGVTLLAGPLLSHLELVHIALLYLLGVLLVAVFLGRWPGVVAAIVSSLAFAHVFVPPHYSLAITDPSYLITAVEMLAVALITGHLTADLADKAEEARARESSLQSLYVAASQLAAAASREDVARVVEQFLPARDGQLVLFVVNAEGVLEALSVAPLPAGVEVAAANAALQLASPAQLPHVVGNCRYYALKTATGDRGVLALRPGARAGDESHEIDDIDESGYNSRFATLASLLGVTLERVRYADMARDATLKAETEQLRSSILTALSHDIRTPLTTVIGLADTLTRSLRKFDPAERELLLELHGQALQMNWIVSNLLDMARLKAGRVCLQREWQPLEEVVGSSLELMKGRLAGRPLVLALEADLPLLEFDAVLIERVICNLIENALKFAPAGEIRLEAQRRDDVVAISVIDQGNGIPAGDEERIFEMFVQGRQESTNPGVGLGLAICRSIVIAHGGTISAANHPPQGTAVTFTLPLGEPPEAEEAPLGELEDLR